MKRVFITGGHRGIGKAIVNRFKMVDYEIVAPTREELDLNNSKSIHQYLKEHKGEKFDIIINNAGCNDIHEIEDITDEEIENMINVNLIAPIKLIRGMIGPMKTQRYGRIINIGSIWASVSKAGRCVYSASKNGLHGVTNTLAVELAEYNILVNTVCPGFTMTELTKKNNTPKQIEEVIKDVLDQHVYELYYDELFYQIKEEVLYLLKAEEKRKNIETVLEICEIMTKIPAKRNAHLISFGGGIVQDITGFAANILYRGIKWTFIPTTLLAACDSCIGGKTSLNYKNFKNLLGTFFPPDDIYISSQFFNTLSEKDFKSGLGEVVKFNLMFGIEGLDRIERDIFLLLQRDEKVLNEYVKNSLLFKKYYIETDEYDTGIRIHLNFAHTFGHAFESVSNYVIPHGIAVALGMIVANRISLSRGWLTFDKVQRMEKVLFQIIPVNFVPISMDIDKIILSIRKDKKQKGNELTAVLMYDDMKLRIIHDLKINEVEMGMQYLSEKH